jgi:hypothetical protein
MSLDAGLQSRLAGLFKPPRSGGEAKADHCAPRLAADAKRLWNRIGCFMKMQLVASAIDADGLELSCWGLQLPLRQVRNSLSGKMGHTNLRERCEQSAELLVSALGGHANEDLLDRSARLLHETPQRIPTMDEARLLADAINLDDFGMIGLINQTIQIASQGESVRELAIAWKKREQYGYWEARLKDGFHFEPVRKLALRRLEQARKAGEMLARELDEDESAQST